MDLLLLLSYAAICVAVFKIFKIPLTKWSVPTAALGGVVLVGTLVLLMNYNHPHSKVAIRAYITTPIIPNVKGTVIEVTAERNTPMKKGDVLFKIDPEPFQLVVDQKKAELELANDQVLQMEKSIAQAEFLAANALSDRNRTKQAYDRFEKALVKGSASELETDSRRQLHLAALATLNERIANHERKKLELKAHRENTIKKLEAELNRAQFDLDSTIVRAPTDGYATQVALQPGMMATSLPLRPVMVFVHHNESMILASFRQNATQRLQSGHEAEILFTGVPGRVFKAEVVRVLPAMAEGEVQAGGKMLRAKDVSKQGLVTAVVEIKDDTSGYIIPDGSFAEVAVYSDKMHHVAIMRKILLRMKSWQNYIYLDH